MKEKSERALQYVFFVSWLISSIFFGWQLSQRSYSFESPFAVLNLIVLLLCTVVLIVWIPNPIIDEPSQAPTKRKLFIILIIVCTGLLFLIPIQTVRVLLFVLPGIALVTLLLLKQRVEKREGLYALSLALLTGVTGLGAGWITWVTPTVWGILQVCLVLTSFLAGWSILRYTGLRLDGIGKSSFLSDGMVVAFRAFFVGFLISIPWAFMNVIMGGSANQTWVKAWWQPFIAIQPGIAEEAWGRIFLVPLLFLLFRRVSQPRAAFTAALFIMAYWFAYLHTPGGLDGIASTVIVGTLYSLPVSYLCLYRNLETAIGWHFGVDFVKFVFALIIFNG